MLDAAFLRKTTSTFLSVLMFWTSAAQAAPEQNFWAARQSALAVAEPRLAPPLPDLRPVPPVPAPDRDDQSPESFVRRILPAHASVRAVARPAGRPASGVVILLQDVHQNAEAQGHLSALVRHLALGTDRLLLGLEGAFGSIDLNRAHRVDDQASLKQAADYLLRTNRISGAVHGALLSRSTGLTAAGVDDERLYWSHVAAYQAGVPLRESLDRRLAEAEAALGAMTSRLSPPAAAKLALSAAHRSGALSLPDYVERLAALRPGDDRGRLPARLPELAKLLEARRLERSLDFRRAEAERMDALRRLASVMTPADARRLIDLAAAYRLGRLTHRDFFSALGDTLAAHGLPLSGSPLFAAYLRYVSLVDNLNAEAMFGELTRLESLVTAEIRAGDEDRATLDFAERLALVRRLRDQALTPDDWRRYLDLRDAGSPASTLLPDARILEPFERFYVVAARRDAALARNVLARMKAERRRAAVVVTGGFHARGLTDRLVASGLAVVSVVPSLTSADPASGSAYLSYFSREKTPLDRLFEGRRLYLPTPPAQLGALGALTVLAREAADPAARVQNPAAEIEAIDGRPAPGASSEDLPGGQASVTVPEGRFTASRLLSSVRFTASLAGRVALRPLSIVHPIAVVMYQRGMTRASSNRIQQAVITAGFAAYMVVAGPYFETELLSFLTSTLASGVVAGLLFVAAHALAIVATRVVVRRLYDGRAVVPISVVGSLRNPFTLSLFLLGSALVAAPFLGGASPEAFWTSFAVHAALNFAYVAGGRILVGDAQPQAPLSEAEQVSEGLSIARFAGHLIEELQEATGKDIDHPKRGLVRLLIDLQARARGPYERSVARALRNHEILRVVQWNMLEKPESSRWQLQKDQFAALLEDGRPHVVTLQEVTPGDEFSSAAELARAHGYAIHEWEPRGVGDRGVPPMAILYDPSFELVEAWEKKVSGAGVLLGVTLRSRETGKVVHVATCRLSYHPINDRDLREYQRQLINEELARRAGSDDAVVLTGDFNPADENEVTAGLRQFPGFSDAFRETNPVSRGVTFSMANSYTKNYSRGPTAGLPSSKRLDLVLTAQKPLDATVEFNERPFSSDHFALKADVALAAVDLQVPVIRQLSSITLAEMRRLVAAGALAPGDAVLLYEAWGALQGWTIEEIQQSIPDYFPLLAPRLGVDGERWARYAAPARREPFETSVWYNNMRAPMEKRLRTRWQALFTARVAVTGGKEVLLPDYLLERAREAARVRHPRLERFVPFLSSFLSAQARRRITMANVRLVVHGSFLYGDTPNDLDIDVYIEGTSLTRELLAGQKALVRFDRRFNMAPIPLHASAFGLDRDPLVPSVNDSFLTTAFWNGLPVWGDAEPEAPGVMDRLRSIEEYLGFIEIKRHENRFDKTRGYLIGFLYFLLAQSSDPDMKGAIGRELDKLEGQAGAVMPADEADRVLTLARGWFDQLVRASVSGEGYEINFAYKGGYLGVASVYLRTAREKINRTIYRNLGAWALMRTAIVLYLAIRPTDPAAPRTERVQTLLDLSSELDTLRKVPFTPEVKGRLLEIERTLIGLQKEMADAERESLAEQERDAREKFELEIADAKKIMQDRVRGIELKRENLEGRKLREADAAPEPPGPPVQTKVAPNPVVASALFAVAWLAFLVGVDPSPAAAAALVISPAIAALLYAIYGRALEGSVAGFRAPPRSSIARWLADRFNLTLVWINEEDWLSGAMSSPYAEVRGSTILIRERAAGNVLALALLIAHEAHGERLFAGGPAWLFRTRAGAFLRESVATVTEFIFAVPVLVSLRRLAQESPVSSRGEERLAATADEIISLGRARAAGNVAAALEGAEAASWDIGGDVAGTDPSGPLSLALLERLPDTIAARLADRVRSGAMSAGEAASVRSAISGWLGRSSDVDGKTLELVARRTDLTGGVLARLDARRGAGLRDTIYVDAADEAADPVFYDGVRRRGLAVVAVPGLIDNEARRIRLDAMGEEISRWDEARRRNTILAFPGQLALSAEGGAAFERLVEGVSVITIETLIAAVEAGLRSVRVMPLDALIQASRITALQA